MALGPLRMRSRCACLVQHPAGRRFFFSSYWQLSLLLSARSVYVIVGVLSLILLFATGRSTIYTPSVLVPGATPRS